MYSTTGDSEFGLLITDCNTLGISIPHSTKFQWNILGFLFKIIDLVRHRRDIQFKSVLRSPRSTSRQDLPSLEKYGREVWCFEFKVSEKWREYYSFVLV